MTVSLCFGRCCPDCSISWGFCKKGGRDLQAQVNAVTWLDELIGADQQYAEWRMPLNKLLFGLHLYMPLEWQLPDDDQQEVMVMQQWFSQLSVQLPYWQRLSVTDMCQLFLQRPAWLMSVQGNRVLHIQPKIYNVLLKRLVHAMEVVNCRG